jgi:hypothetical protein
MRSLLSQKRQSERSNGWKKRFLRPCINERVPSAVYFNSNRAITDDSLKNVHLRAIPMAAKLRLRYTLPGCTGKRITNVPGDITIRALISFIAQKHGVPVGTVSVDDGILDEDEPFAAFYDLQNQIFAFSKSVITSSDSSSSPAQLPFDPRSHQVEPPVSAYLRDFRGLKEIRVPGDGSFGTVKLFEYPQTQDKIAIKFFNRAAGSDTFFREIEALIRLTHPCILWIIHVLLHVPFRTFRSRSGAGGSGWHRPCRLIARISRH